MRRVVSLILIMLLVLNSVSAVFASDNKVIGELSGKVSTSLIASIDEMQEMQDEATLIIKNMDISNGIYLQGVVSIDEVDTEIEIHGEIYKSYYNEGDLIVKLEDEYFGDLRLVHFGMHNNIESHQLFLDKNLVGKDIIQLIFVDENSGRIIVIEDKFNKLSKVSFKEDYKELLNPFIEHWWIKTFEPSVVDNNGIGNTRSNYTEVDFDSYYSTRYDLGSGYWAEYYIKVEQTHRFNNLSYVGDETIDKAFFNNS